MKMFFALLYMGSVVAGLMLSYHILHSLMDLYKAPLPLYESLMWYMVVNVVIIISASIFGSCKD